MQNATGPFYMEHVDFEKVFLRRIHHVIEYTVEPLPVQKHPAQFVELGEHEEILL